MHNPRREINDESTLRIPKIPICRTFFDLTACKPFTACLYTERNCWGFMFYKYKNMRFKVDLSTLELANIANTVSQDLANI